ncbi:MAG TPA: cell division protein SepF [Clostridia bacterium]|nr:cell division protein SepF [Clostridia bacterium]
MEGFVKKLLDFIGLEEAEDDEMYGAEEAYEEDVIRDDNVVDIGNRGKRKGASANSNVINIPSQAQMKMIVYHPISYEDTQNIIDNLKSRKPVIVNMEELEIDCAQRILDFMAGAIYALNGTIYKVSRGIFVVAPANCDVIGNGEAAI